MSRAKSTVNSEVAGHSSATPTASQQANQYSLTVQPRVGPSAKDADSLDLVELAHYVASLLTAYGLPRIYTSATAEVLRAPELNQYVLDLSVDTFQIADRPGFFDAVQLFVIVELSITLKHLACEHEALGKHVVRWRDRICGRAQAEKQEALHKPAEQLARIVAQDIGRGEFGAALRAQPEQPEWEGRLLDSQDSFMETSGHSAEWYKAAAKVRGKEILAKAAQTRRQEAKRRLDAHAVEEERRRIAAYARCRYRLEESAVVDMLRQHDAREFRLLQETIHLEEENSDVR
jgi:hypothetical protein